MQELNFKNAWVYDIEIFPNCFTLVARMLDTKEYRKFVLHESRNDMDDLMSWLETRPFLIGYNSLDFDGQLVEHIWRSAGKTSAEDIYEFIQKLPINTGDRFSTVYSEWDLSFKGLDLFRINHYDNKKTSLKWLEFTTRWGKLKDLPVDHTANISKSKLVEVLRYNTNDVDITYDFYYRCVPMIELRQELSRQFRQPRIMNMSDSSFGSYIFEHILTKDFGIKKTKLKKGTKRTKIIGKDCLVDYICFDSPEFQQVHQTFLDRIYDNVLDDGIKGSQYEQTVMYDDMVYVFGSGGLHACYKAGEYEPDDDHVIMSVDVKSYYPNLAISNNFFPEHIGSSFCRIYGDVYNKRTTFAKGTAMNYAYKIALNAVYGKSNSEYSLFYDPMYTLKITVNGQLLLAMLAEQLGSLGRVLMVNTDGIEIMIPKKLLGELKDICSQWELLTDLELEYVNYKKLVIKDVNNYIALDDEGNGKRKGMFEIYEDITEEGGKPHSYHKTPNAPVIPQALYDYYINDMSVYDSIHAQNNIHDYSFGLKKQKKFEYWLFTSEEGVITIDKRVERVIRYYITSKGANIYKFWKDDRKNNIQAVNKGQLVTLAMNIRNPYIVRTKKIPKSGGLTEDIVQYEVDRSYYIREAEKTIDIINNRTRDKAYLNYMKQLEKEQKALAQGELVIK